MSHWPHHFLAFNSVQIRFQFQTVVPLIAAAAISIDSLFPDEMWRNSNYFAFGIIAEMILKKIPIY